LLGRELLQRAGAEVVTASDGQECLMLLEEQPFDCVLRGMQMPVMDGLAATRAICPQEHLRQLPFVAMTANTMSGDRERCLEAGMNDHRAKPIEPEQLYKP